MRGPRRTEGRVNRSYKSDGVPVAWVTRTSHKITTIPREAWFTVRVECNYIYRGVHIITIIRLVSSIANPIPVGPALEMPLKPNDQRVIKSQDFIT